MIGQLIFERSSSVTSISVNPEWYSQFIVSSACMSLQLGVRGLTTSRVSGRVSIEFKLNLATRRV